MFQTYFVTLCYSAGINTCKFMTHTTILGEICWFMRLFGALLTAEYANGTTPMSLLLRPRQDGSHFPVDILKFILLNEILCIFIKVSLKFVPMGPINIIPALVWIIYRWRDDEWSIFSVRYLDSVLISKYNSMVKDVFWKSTQSFW